MVEICAGKGCRRRILRPEHPGRGQVTRPRRGGRAKRQRGGRSRYWMWPARAAGKSSATATGSCPVEGWLRLRVPGPRRNGAERVGNRSPLYLSAVWLGMDRRCKRLGLTCVPQQLKRGRPPDDERSARPRSQRPPPAVKREARRSEAPQEPSGRWAVIEDVYDTIR